MRLLVPQIGRHAHKVRRSRWRSATGATVRPWLEGSPPGTRFLYGNTNTILVGAALEKLHRRTWEELIQEQIFQPLALAGAGLGPQSTPGLTDAPLGPRRVQDTLQPMLAGPNGDNLPVIGPAGTVHMGLLGAARWVGWTAGQGRRGPLLVEQARVTATEPTPRGPDGAPPSR